MAEVAGLALGAFPVCIALIQYCQRGIATIQDMREYHKVLKEFRRELQVECCKFESSLYIVFDDTMSPDECAEIFRNPEQAEVMLNTRLRSPNLVQSFIDSVVAMRKEVEGISKELEAIGAHAAKNVGGNAQACDEQVGINLGARLKLAVSKEEYSKSMTRITKINADILHLLGRGQKPVIDQDAPKNEIALIQKHYKRVQNNAKVMFDALKQKIDGCATGEHSVNLCLEERTPRSGKSRVSGDDHEILSFRILFRLAHAVGSDVQSVMEDRVLVWKELAIEVEPVKNLTRIEEIHREVNPGQRTRVAFVDAEKDISVQLSKTKIEPQTSHTDKTPQTPGAGINHGSEFTSENVSDRLESGSSGNQRQSSENGVLEQAKKSPRRSIKPVGRFDKLFGGLSRKVSRMSYYRVGKPEGGLSSPTRPAPAVQAISSGIPSQPCGSTPQCAPTTAAESHVQSTSSTADSVSTSDQESHPISNICHIIRIPKRIRERHCLGLLGVGVGDSNSTSRYKVWSMPVGGCFDLEDTLTCSTWNSRPVSLQAILEASYRPKLKLKDRLSIGIKLASSVIQLHHTWWLNKQWGKRDIIFFLNPETDTLLTQTPMVRHDLCSSSQPIQSSSTALRGLRIKNKALFLLGLVLWELWSGRCLEESDCGVNESQACVPRMDYLQWSEPELLYAAYYALDQMDDAPDDYTNAVRTCLFGGIQTDSQTFIAMVWENIVCPLERVYMAFDSGHRQGFQGGTGF